MISRKLGIYHEDNPYVMDYASIFHNFSVICHDMSLFVPFDCVSIDLEFITFNLQGKPPS